MLKSTEHCFFFISDWPILNLRYLYLYRNFKKWIGAFMSKTQMNLELKYTRQLSKSLQILICLEVHKCLALADFCRTNERLGITHT